MKCAAPVALLVCLSSYGRLLAMAAVLDQSNESAQTQGYVGEDWGRYASVYDDSLETFTVGISGKLTRIELLVNPLIPNQYPFPLHVELQPTDQSGKPYGYTAPLAACDGFYHYQNQYVYSAPTDPEWLSFDLPGDGVDVVAGDMLAIAARSSDNDGYRWFGSLQDQYSKGSAYWRSGYLGGGPYSSSSWVPSAASDLDFSFRTFVVPAVPEPSATLLFAGVLTSIGTMRRRPTSHNRV